MENNATIESLRIEHAHLDSMIREEESHIWKNLIKIEQLKREKLHKKDQLLRQTLQTGKQ